MDVHHHMLSVRPEISCWSSGLNTDSVSGRSCVQDQQGLITCCLTGLSLISLCHLLSSKHNFVNFVYRCVLMLVLWSNHRTWTHKVTGSNPGTRMLHTTSVCLAEPVWAPSALTCKVFPWGQQHRLTFGVVFSRVLLQSDPCCFSGCLFISALKMVQWFKTQPVDLETWDQTLAQTTKGRPQSVCVLCSKQKPQKLQTSSVAFACGICAFDRLLQSGSWRRHRAGESGWVSWLDKSQLAGLVSVFSWSLFPV